MTRLHAAVLAALSLMAIATSAIAAQPAPHLFPEQWTDGTNPSEAQTQVQRVDVDTYVIRQSVRTNFEAPFLYLLFGKDRAILFDSGAGGLKIRPVIDGLVAQWLGEHHRASIPLIIAHTHGHGDHHQGDAEFVGRPDTTVVGLTPDQVAGFFGIRRWPTDVAVFDLGGRKLSIIPAPGHQPAHIIVFDPRTRWLIAGDSLYPGRLYVRDFPAYRDSIDRVAAFCRGRRVSWILGAHIEMTDQPGKDFANAAPSHPNEHRLELPFADLLELQRGLHGMGDAAVRQTHDDFIVFPLPAK
jgi:glyoxylase-like metal-dependent hydrolase (beta-lactamase superfamily II)